MQIRCGSCHGPVWVQITSRTKDRTVVQCHTCSQEYDLGSMLERIDLANLHQDALVLAKGNEIDLLAAYSVLLGIFNLDAARDGCDPSLCPSTETPDPNADNDYDHAFVDAIKAGHLSPEQAMARGNRDAFAASLVRQHRLTLKQALAVTDNRIPLLAAIRARKPKARINLDSERQRVSVPLVVAAAVIVVVAILVVLTRNSNETVDPGAQPGPARTELSAAESN
jgi:hypothetical protein